MSKRRRKARGRTGELPFDSPNWMPVAEAHRRLTDLLDNGDLAAKDLTAAVAAKRSDKRLPCMQRAIPRHIAPDQDREIVPLSFWDKYEFGLDVSGRLEILRKNHFPPYAVEFPFPVAFFVWRPKFEKIWPGVAASAPARSSPAGIEAPPPRPRGSPRTHDWFSICGEIARRCVNPANGRVVVPEKENALVNEMLVWLDDQNLARPAASEMAEAVRRVCAPLREVQR
jgi:hypothetical protein